MKSNQITDDLATAMMLIEMNDDAPFAKQLDLVQVAHAIIQNVRAEVLGHGKTQEKLISETLAAVWANVAIADAKCPLLKD